MVLVKSPFIYLRLALNSSISDGCHNIDNIGNGYCEDDLFTEACFYDDQDCCDPTRNFEFCQNCTCQPSSCHGVQDWVGDLSCDDDLNTPGCNFDNGDCCLDFPNLNLDFCSECICYDSGKKWKVEKYG